MRAAFLTVMTVMTVMTVKNTVYLDANERARECRRSQPKAAPPRAIFAPFSDCFKKLLTVKTD